MSKDGLPRILFNRFIQLSDFDIHHLIDHGTEGAVFLATSKQARLPDKTRQYALKVMFNIFELTSVTQVTMLPWKFSFNSQL